MASPIKSQNPIVITLFQAVDGRGLKVADIAKIMAVHPNTVTNWRHGHVNMSIVDAFMLAGNLGLEISIGVAH